jgi:hypothetical protein
MATPTPPATAPASGIASTLDDSSSIPASHRFPRLVSSQYRFTTADAIKHLDKQERHVYRVVVKLRARQTISFSQKSANGLPWTFAVRDFLQMLQTYDEKAMILPRRDKVKINKLSCHTEVPESTDEFERDYAWNSRTSGNTVTLNMMIATTKDYENTFKRGQVFEKLKDEEWFINLDRLETQEVSAKVGVFLFAHNRWANPEDLMAEVHQLIAPLRCEDIDIRVDRPVRTYYDKDATIEIEHGRQKKQKIRTRWPAIFAPLDIVAQLRTAIVNNWPRLQTDPTFAEFNCKQYMFIPDTPSQRTSRNSTPSAQDQKNYSHFLHCMRQQNIFLDKYSTVVVLQNVGNIAANFTWTQEMTTTLGVDETHIGKRETLRTFLTNITRNSDHSERTVHAINREKQRTTYSLLVSNVDAAELRETIETIVPLLQRTPAFKDLRVGGSHGAFRDENLEISKIGYLAAVGTSDEFAIEPTVLDAGGDIDMTTSPTEMIDFNVPPAPRRRGRNQRNAKLVRPGSATAAMLYRDVLTTTPINNPYLLSTQHSTQSTSSLSTAMTNPITQESNPINMESLVTNTQFQRMMADLIQPHVEAQMAPMRQEVATIRNDMAIVQESTTRLEATVSTMERDIGPQLQAIMSHLGVSKPTPAPVQQSPPKKQCTNKNQHNGPFNPGDGDPSGTIHSQQSDEGEASMLR